MTPDYARAAADLLTVIIRAQTDFRATGRDAQALNYPLSPAGRTWLCAFNGMPEDQAPWTSGFASNEAMRRQIEREALTAPSTLLD